jgi:hypothetical protein
MKRLRLLLSICGLLGLSSAMAQDYTAAGIRVNLGTGFWAVNPGFMPFHGGMEFGITEEISLGFDLGWRLYDDGPTHHFIVFQARVDYYFNTLIGLGKTWDVYAGLQMGPGFFSAPAGYAGQAKGVNFALDGVAGGRWYFAEGVGLNAEVGLMGVFPAIVGPTPFTTIGISFRM